MSGTRHNGVCCPNDLLNRSSTGIPETSTVIGRAWDTWSPSSDLQDQNSKDKSWEVVMSSRSENVRAQARAKLERQTPIADDASLLPLQEEVAAIIGEAKRR